MTSSRTALIALVAALLACSHLQESGQYALTAIETIRDTCGLVPTPEALWDGRLQVDGDVVRMEYDLFEMELRGSFKETSEGFYLDGSAANVLADIGGATCRIDLATVRLEGHTDNSESFTGSLRVDYLAEADDRCNCEAWFTLRGEKTGN